MNTRRKHKRNCTWRFLRDCGSADMPIPRATFLLFVGVPVASCKYFIRKNIKLSFPQIHNHDFHVCQGYLLANCLPLQGKDGLVLVQLGLQTHVLQLQLLDPHLQRLDICPHAPHPERRISEIYAVSGGNIIRLVACSDPDRQAAICRGTLESRPTFLKLFFSKVASRPSNTSSQPTVCDPEILGQNA